MANADSVLLYWGTLNKTVHLKMKNLSLLTHLYIILNKMSESLWSLDQTFTVLTKKQNIFKISSLVFLRTKIFIKFGEGV